MQTVIDGIVGHTSDDDRDKQVSTFYSLSPERMLYPIFRKGLAMKITKYLVAWKNI